MGGGGKHKKTVEADGVIVAVCYERVAAKGKSKGRRRKRTGHIKKTGAGAKEKTGNQGEIGAIQRSGGFLRCGGK